MRIAKIERKVFMGKTAQGERALKNLKVKVSHLPGCQKYRVHGWPGMKGVGKRILPGDPSSVQL